MITIEIMVTIKTMVTIEIMMVIMSWWTRESYSNKSLAHLHIILLLLPWSAASHWAHQHHRSDKSIATKFGQVINCLPSNTQSSSCFPQLRTWQSRLSIALHFDMPLLGPLYPNPFFNHHLSTQSIKSLMRKCWYCPGPSDISGLECLLWTV